MTRTRRERLGVLWLAAGAAALASRCLRPIANPDIYWHLSAGAQMLEKGAIPRRDFLSHTRHAAPWIDFEWLAQLLYALVHRTAGFPGLIALKTLVLGATAASFVLLLRRLRVSLAAQGLSLLVLAAGLIPNSFVKPSNFSLLLFTGTLWLAEMVRLEDLKDRRRAGLAAFMLFALWANLHGGFIFGLALLGAYSAGQWRAQPAQRSLYAVLFAAAAVGTLCNPFGTGVYAVLLRHAADAAFLQQAIGEWAPASPRNVYLYPFWAVLAAAAAAIIFRLRHGRPVVWAQVLALAGLAVAALRHWRTAPLFILAALPVIATMEKEFPAPRTKIEKILLRLCPFILAGAVLAHFAAYGPWRLPRRAIAHASVPEQAADFIAAISRDIGPTRLYNPWGWGGYLGYRLHPTSKVFMDGRYIFHDLLVERVAATKTPETFNAFLKKYDANLIVLKRDRPPIVAPHRMPDGTTRYAPRPFYMFFMPQERWSLIYWDALALIFVRSDAGDARWRGEHVYAMYHPDDEAALRRALDSKLIGRDLFRLELCRHLREAGEDAETRRLLEYAGGSGCLEVPKSLFPYSGPLP
ncbi:MAG: hypothetical protein ABIJ96_07815 [Elusimicrobiota bacterium]